MDKILLYAKNLIHYSSENLEPNLSKSKDKSLERFGRESEDSIGFLNKLQDDLKDAPDSKVPGNKLENDIKEVNESDEDFDEN